MPKAKIERTILQEPAVFDLDAGSFICGRRTIEIALTAWNFSRVRVFG